MVQILPVRTRAQMREFVQFPIRLYANNPYYCPALLIDELDFINSAKNPAFDYSRGQCFLAVRGGQTVGTIMGIVNDLANDKWQTKRARFSHFDCINDYEVSAALIGAVEDWARAQGMDEVHGPMGFCDMDKEGMLVEGFDELSTYATLYNHPYYVEHMHRLGYQKDVDWIEYQIMMPEKLDPKLEKVAELVSKRFGYKVLHFTKRSQIRPYIHKAFAVLNESYEQLYGTYPLPPRHIQSIVDSYMTILNPTFVKLVVDKADQIVGVGVAMPSVTRALQRCRGRLLSVHVFDLLRSIKKSDRLDLYLVGVTPEHQNKGVNSLLMVAMLNEFVGQGYQLAESNPELETNKQVQAQWKYFQTRQHRRRRVFVKTLD